MIKEKLNIEDYVIEECAFSLKKANIIGGILMIPEAILLFLIYFFINEKITEPHVIYILPALIAGIIIHEFIHGFVWHLFCENKWKSIKFKIDKKTLCPYTVCREVIPISSYKIGVIMPGLITGLLPYIIGLILNNATIVYTGICLICTAIGDIMILFTLFNKNKKCLVQDHPTMCGCIVYTKK